MPRIIYIKTGIHTIILDSVQAGLNYRPDGSWIFLSSVDGLLIDSLGNVYSEVGTTPTETLLGDTYPMAYMWDLKKVRTDYEGDCVEVVRDSDLATLDVGFSGNSLDTATMIAWAEADGATSVTIRQWYSQGTSEGALAETNTAYQPEIWNSTIGLRYDANGNLSAYFDGIFDHLSIDFGQTYAQPNTAFMVLDQFAGSSILYALDGIGAGARHVIYEYLGAEIIATAGIEIIYNSTFPTGTTLASAIYDDADGVFYVNDNLRTGNIGTESVNGLTVMQNYVLGGGNLTGHVPCLYFDPTSRASDIADINDAIKLERGIS